MYHVLVPIDQNEDRAVAQADAVRRLPDAGDSVEATLLHVFDDADEAAQNDLSEWGAVERFTETLGDAGVATETIHRTGPAAQTILDVANELGTDMIVLGGRKRSPLGSLLFGSVSQSVLLDADRPVTITGAEVKRDPSHRCQDCGRTYYVDASEAIESCQSCGGVNVERVEGEQAAA